MSVFEVTGCPRDDDLSTDSATVGDKRVVERCVLGNR